MKTSIVKLLPLLFSFLSLQATHFSCLLPKLKRYAKNEVAEDIFVGCLLSLVTDELENMVNPCTRVIENSLLDKQCYKMGLSWCIFSRNLTTMLLNVAREKCVNLLIKQRNLEWSAVCSPLLSVSRASSVSFFIYNHILLDSNIRGLMGGYLAYCREWNRRISRQSRSAVLMPIG